MTRFLSLAARLLVCMLLLGLVTLSLANAFRKGICCADDGAFASIAKNLAEGRGYTSNLSPGLNTVSFGPVLTITGAPAHVLLVSLAIRLLGDRPWVPGVVHVAIWTTLFLALWRAGLRLGSAARLGVAGAVFLLLAYAVSGNNFGQWFAMLGEVPATLLILLAFVVWAVDPDSPARRLGAASLLCLACLFKFLALLYFGVFVALFTIDHCTRHGLSATGLWAKRAAIIGVVFAAPLLAFEVVGLLTLGASRYVQNLQQATAFVGSRGVEQSRFQLAQLGERLGLFHATWGVSIAALLVLMLWGGHRCVREGVPPLSRLAAVLVAAVFVHMSYWLFLSTGYPRYAFIGLIAGCAALALPFLLPGPPATHAIYGLALLVAMMGTADRLRSPIVEASRRSQVREAQERMVGFLAAHVDQRPFVAQSWAQIADLEYLLPDAFNFTSYAALPATRRRDGYLLVTNSRFDYLPDAAFWARVSRCGPPRLSAPPFTVYRCLEPGSLPPE